MVKGMDAVLYLYTGGGFFLSGKNRGRFLEDRLHFDYRKWRKLFVKKKKREEKKGIVGSFFHNFRFHVLTRMPVGSGVAEMLWEMGVCPLKLLENCGRKSENESECKVDGEI